MKRAAWAWGCVAGLAASALYCVASSVWFIDWLWIGVALLATLIYLGAAFALPMLRRELAASKRRRERAANPNAMFRKGTRMPDRNRGKVLEFKPREDSRK